MKLLRCSVGLWLVCQISYASVAAPAEPLRLLTEHSPPGQFLDDNGKLTGATVELIRILQQRLQEPGDIELMPWGRALSIARNSGNTALFETVRTAEREPWFKWVGPLTYYKTSLYGLKQRVGSDMADLKLPGKFIACSYRNSVTAEDIKRLGFTEGRNLILNSKTGDCLDMLIFGRIDLIAVTEYSLPGLTRQVQAAGHELLPVHYLADRKRYLAFSPDITDARIANWQAALEQSYRDGTMRRLYQGAYPDAMIVWLEEFAARPDKQ